MGGGGQCWGPRFLGPEEREGWGAGTLGVREGEGWGPGLAGLRGMGGGAGCPESCVPPEEVTESELLDPWNPRIPVCDDIAGWGLRYLALERAWV